MAFNHKNLSVLAYANGFTLWHHLTPAGDDPCAPHYFRDAHALVRTNDVILSPPFGIFLVASRTDDEALVDPWPSLDALLGPEPSPEEMAELEEQLQREFEDVAP